jgi:hypothetical protein
MVLRSTTRKRQLQLQLQKKIDLQNKHYLINLAPEILLDIVAYLPPSDFLALVQTFRYLLLFFKEHAARICNNAILSNYAKAAHIMKSVKVDGWLMAGLDCCSGFKTYQENIYKNAETRAGFITPNPLSTAANIKLTIPGPQYLTFLERFAEEIEVSSDIRRLRES